VEEGTLRDAWIREESETGAGWPGRTGRARAAAWRARREGEEINVGTEREEEGSEGETAGDVFGREKGSGAAEGRTEVGGGVVGAGTAEKTGVVTLEDAVEEGTEETGFSEMGSTVCALTGVTDETEDRYGR